MRAKYRSKENFSNSKSIYMLVYDTIGEDIVLFDTVCNGQ